MHGVVSLLDDRHSMLVESLWAELEHEFGLRGIYVTPYPHLSYQIAEGYDLGLLEPMLEQFAGQRAAFRVTTSGVGIFTGARPVLYIAVVRSPALTAFHQALWQAIAGAGSGVMQYYEPDRWVPHITIGFGDIGRDKLAEAVRLLGERDLNWEIVVDNVALIYDTGAKQELRFRMALAGV